MSPTPRAAGLLVIAALSALVIPPWLAAGLCLAIVAAVVADAWPARHLPDLERRVPRSLARGVPAEMSVTADGGAASRLSVRQPAPPDVRIEPQENPNPLRATITVMRRGRHRLEPAATKNQGPLGLGAWYHRAGTGDELIVYPDLPAARRLAVAVRQGRFAEEGRRSRGPLGLGTDLERIRDYQPDDDIRQVNWRATARRGSPMSNQWRVEQDREIICLIDSGRLMSAPIGDRTRLDAAVDAVAAISAVADEIGDRVGVVAFDRTIRRQLSPRRAGGVAVVAAIFDLEPTLDESDYALAFQTVASAKRSLIIVQTDLLDSAAARPLLEATRILCRRHAVVVASILDDDLQQQVETPAANLAEAYRTVAALTVLEARAEVARQLRGTGVEVVEAPLRLLSSACVGAYLRARSRARL